MLRKLFGGKTDIQAEAISAHNERVLKETTKAAKSLYRLLSKNGVTMDIVIATGEGKHD